MVEFRSALNSFTIWHYTGKQIATEIVEKRANPRPATVDLPAATEHELYQVLMQPVPLHLRPSAPVPSPANSAQAKQNLVSSSPKSPLPLENTLIRVVCSFLDINR